MVMVPLDLKIDLQGGGVVVGRIKFQSNFRLSFIEASSQSAEVTGGWVGGEIPCRIFLIRLKSSCFVLASVRGTCFQVLFLASSKCSG